MRGRFFSLFLKKEGETMEFEVNKTLWKLKFVDSKNSHLRRSDGSWTIGVSDNNVKTVFVSDILSDYMTDRVICHELCHVFSFENDLNIPISTEEIIADFMSLYGRNIIYLADSIMSSLIGRAA